MSTQIRALQKEIAEIAHVERARCSNIISRLSNLGPHASEATDSLLSLMRIGKVILQTTRANPTDPSFAMPPERRQSPSETRRGSNKARSCNKHPGFQIR